jgi:hypothetical protein
MPEATPLISSSLELKNVGNSSMTFDIAQTKNGASQPITEYRVTHTMLMHLIVVRDDFSQFEHLHPTLDASTGHFTQQFSGSPAHRYYIYADSEPKDMPQQVFRFTVQPGVASSQTSAPVPAFTPSPKTTLAGPYEVTLSETTLRANAPAEIGVTIDRGGKPATDLRPYLGAPAHVVFINTSSLDYIHVHPMLAGEMSEPHGMSDMQMDDDKPAAGPKLMMHLPAIPAGSYKVWMQFQGGTTAYTVPFTIVAR